MAFTADYHGAVVHPSPNFSAANQPGWERMPLQAIVLHGTAGTFPGCLDWLCRANGDSSAHYLIDRDGTTYQLVPESASAWANGVVSQGGIYPASPNPNLFTLSIETVNDANNSLPYTDAQHAAVVALITDIRRRHGLLPLIPHSAIDPVNRPFCPGLKIDLAAIDQAAQPPMTPRPFPALYLQRDPRWAAQLLGNVPGVTLGEYGCILCCYAAKAGYYGHAITPPQLNSALETRHIYASNGQGGFDMMPDDALHSVYPDLTLYKTYEWQSVPADLSVLKTLADDPTLTVTLELDFDHDPSDGIASHFVEMAACNGLSVLVYDPWYGDGTHADNLTKNYGTNPAQTIQRAIVYKGAPPTPPVVRYVLTASQWLQLTAKPNNAVPGAPQVPAGAAIVCIGNPVTVTDAKEAKSRWQEVGYGSNGKLWTGYVLSRFVKAV